LKREPGKVIGRVVVDRAIRLNTGLAGGAGPAVGDLPPRGASKPDDFRCSGCGTVVCEGARAKLFSGITLRCTGCGQPNRIPR
jgi:hypothetical protein